MKLAKAFHLILLGAALSFTITGCKTKPQRLTDIPGRNPSKPGDPNAYGQTDTGQPLGQPTTPITTDTKTGGIPLSTKDYSNWNPDASILAAQTIYFDYDKSAIRASEESKLSAVADYLKANSGVAVRVEGNCDERGTEEYNRSLGERRALAAREALAHLGADPDRVVTVSYGEDKPSVQGHNEAAWSKNRRDDFIVLTPPK